jgi:hypothetical protein
MGKIAGAPEFIAVGDNWREIPSQDAADARLRLDGEQPYKLRRASKPRPGDVFLVLGDLEGEGDVRFEDLAEVTWCDHAPYAHDLAYRPVRWR